MILQNEEVCTFLEVVEQLGSGRWGGSDEEQPTTIENKHACSFLMVVG